MDTEQLKKYINAIGLIYIIIPVALIAIAISNFNPITPVQDLWGTFENNKTAKIDLKAAQEEYNAAKLKDEEKKAQPKPIERVIFENPNFQFGAEASFAEPFEEMIDIARDSKIRIKSIKYNYAPSEDPVIKNDLTGYNICEMDVSGVGSYSQIKNFFSGMLSKPYLVRLSNVKIEPWGYDKSILIVNFKMTLYTKA